MLGKMYQGYLAQGRYKKAWWNGDPDSSVVSKMSKMNGPVMFLLRSFPFLAL